MESGGAQIRSPTTAFRRAIGGLGAGGGSVKNIQIVDDSTGFLIQGGAGGAGDVNGPGGAGGAVSGVYVTGISDNTPNSLIKIVGGDGGNSSTTGTGGKGGTVSTVDIGFQLIGTKVFPTIARLADDVLIQGGSGGSGKIGGAGAAVSHLQVITSTPHLGTSGAGPQPVGGPVQEIAILAGTGGESTAAGSGGKTGVGGGISFVTAQNVEADADLSGATILVQAGDGGNTQGAATGSAGGSIKTVSILSFDISVQAGTGSGGKTGGAGGSLIGIDVQQSGPIFATAALFNAGAGGTGAAGNGGAGGSITNLAIDNGDFSTLTLNSGNAGDGGTGNGGKGGAGGSITGMNVTDTDGPSASTITGALVLKTGTGGSGTKGVGKGGALTNGLFSSTNMSADIATGDGGSIFGWRHQAAAALPDRSTVCRLTVEASQNVQNVDTTVRAGAPAGTAGAVKAMVASEAALAIRDVSVVTRRRVWLDDDQLAFGDRG